MRVFWPSGSPREASSGILVGFRNSDFDIFVVTVLQDVEVRFSLTPSDFLADIQSDDTSKML